MTKKQIIDKHGNLPSWLISLILLWFSKKCKVCGLENGHKLSCSKNY